MHDLQRLTSEQFAAAINAAGGDTVSVEQIDKAITDGMPVNEDQTVHGLRAIAWLLSEHSNG